MKKSSFPPTQGVRNRRYSSNPRIQAQRDEDEFMHTHGSLGCRVTYKIVDALSFDAYGRKRLTTSITRVFKKTKNRSRTTPLRHAYHTEKK